MGETFATVTVVWRSYRALYFYARACTSMIVAACSRHDHDFASKTNARRALLLSSTPRIRIFVGTFGKYTNARPLVGSKRDDSVNIWQISGWREEKGGRVRVWWLSCMRDTKYGFEGGKKGWYQSGNLLESCPNRCFVATPTTIFSSICRKKKKGDFGSRKMELFQLVYLRLKYISRSRSR